MATQTATPRPYAVQGHDAVRSTFEARATERVVGNLLAQAAGGRVLDLGCGSGIASMLERAPVTDYCGVDLREAAGGCGRRLVVHDLRDGLGPVGTTPYDLYIGAFGIASHLSPCQLRTLLAGIAAHARPGSIVALEALGLFSLEWPRLWSSVPGRARTIPYELGADVAVHPWAPGELRGLFAEAGIVPLRAHDRTVQAGPKVGDPRYWPRTPRLRWGMNELLAGRDGSAEVARPVGALPAGAPARLHQGLAARRRELVSSFRGSEPELAEALWALEPRSGGGFGHGLMLVGRVA